ncbi:MAG TPA: hypothetical protein VGP70_12855 [Actinomadura sp.]|nr:hypothetical protein [Actinomadura sp.]
MHGELRVEPDEVLTAQWVTGDQFQILAEPGLQPVWLRLLVAEHLIVMADADLVGVDVLD